MGSTRDPVPRHAGRRALVFGSVIAAFGLAVLGSIGAPAPAAASGGCIPSGSDAQINEALAGPGAKAVLCPGAEFDLAGPVTFTAPDQEIRTAGRPTDDTRATLRIASPTLTTAISGNGESGVVVENVQVDGSRPALGHLDGAALLEMGGAGTDQTIRRNVIRDPRSWSAMHFFEGSVVDDVPQCQHAKVVDNVIGPAGVDSPAGLWADGISLACGNSLVKGNLIHDATDGGIVIFGAPGSTVIGNTIEARTRTLLGGINMVDYLPVHGNYTGTTVIRNVIDAKSAFIKVGIAMGPQVWACWSGTNHGASVIRNTVEGPHFGYGYAVNGVDSWRVIGNVDRATHVGVAAAGCGGMPSDPAGFQVESATASTLQPEFERARLDYVLGVTEP